MFGRISIGITNYQHQYYTSIGSRREAQSWTHQLITKLWATIILPIWQYRNNFFHGLEPSTTPRLYSDIKDEARELFFSTNPDSLLADDRHLLQIPASTVLSRSYHQIIAWINSIEAVIQMVAASITSDLDPGQTRLAPFPPS